MTESPSQSTATYPSEEDRTIAFPGVNALIRTFDQTMQQGLDFLVVTDVTEADFQQLEAARDRRRRHFRFGFDPSTRRLVVTLPTRGHEVAHRTLYSAIEAEVIQAGAFVPCGSTTFKGPRGSQKEADSGGGPRAGLWAGAWPTLVIESGMSQSLSSLRAAMAWWFDASQHQVKIVLLLKLCPAQKRMLIEKYSEPQPGARPGVTTRSRSSPLLCQTITVQADEDNTVASGALVLEHALLFPNAPQRPEDFLLSEERLIQTASTVWDAVRPRPSD